MGHKAFLPSVYLSGILVALFTFSAPTTAEVRGRRAAVSRMPAAQFRNAPQMNSLWRGPNGRWYDKPSTYQLELRLNGQRGAASFANSSSALSSSTVQNRPGGFGATPALGQSHSGGGRWEQGLWVGPDGKYYDAPSTYEFVRRQQGGRPVAGDFSPAIATANSSATTPQLRPAPALNFSVAPSFSPLASMSEMASPKAIEAAQEGPKSVLRLNFTIEFRKDVNPTTNTGTIVGYSCGATPFRKVALAAPNRCEFGFATAAHCLTAFNKDGSLVSPTGFNFTKHEKLNTQAGASENLKVYVSKDYKRPEKNPDGQTRTSGQGDYGAFTLEGPCGLIADTDVTKVADEFGQKTLSEYVSEGEQFTVVTDNLNQVNDNKPGYRLGRTVSGKLRDVPLDKLWMIQVSKDPYNEFNLVQPGDSGGPVVNSRGELVAVTSAKSANINPDKLAKMPDAKEAKRELSTDNGIENLPIPGGPKGEGVFAAVSPGLPQWLSRLTGILNRKGQQLAAK
jgi:hypothetical protein